MLQVAWQYWATVGPNIPYLDAETTDIAVPTGTLSGVWSLIEEE
jgi:hypothetical protein